MASFTFFKYLFFLWPYTFQEFKINIHIFLYGLTVCERDKNKIQTKKIFYSLIYN